MNVIYYVDFHKHLFWLRDQIFSKSRTPIPKIRGRDTFGFVNFYTRFQRTILLRFKIVERVIYFTFIQIQNQDCLIIGITGKTSVFRKCLVP